ncbi:MAG: hypothetical protein U0360_09685, partial [Dehalococcoidia bacterium]
ALQPALAAVGIENGGRPQLSSGFGTRRGARGWPQAPLHPPLPRRDATRIGVPQAGDDGGGGS